MPVERREARDVAQSRRSLELCTVGAFQGYKRLHWIHSAASRLGPQDRLHNLMHHLNEDNLQRAFRALKGSRACGIDQVTKHDYKRNLESNVQDLHRRLRGGGWRPRPSREVLIPKPQGGTRALAIGCVEDKIVQTAVSKVLEAIYEPVFYPSSFGFRRGKSAHQGLKHLYRAIRTRKQSGCVVEIDIEKFFDSMDHDWLMKHIQHRISDPHFLRLIRRLLRNSTLGTDGEARVNECGAPQGSPASPILANIYLHYLLDEWFHSHFGQDGEMARYADDVVFVFRDEATAAAFRDALTERMREGGLRINAEKSKVVPFSDTNPQGNVNFLGFTFYWGRTLRGRMLKVKTSTKSLNRSMKAFTAWIKAYRNRWTLKRLWRMAELKIRGHYQYFGVSTNGRRLNHFYWTCLQSLYKWLNRRSQKRSFDWAGFKRRLHFDPLPKPLLGFELIDITGDKRTEWKHKPKSRMRKLRTYGSVRSAGQQPAFT